MVASVGYHCMAPPKCNRSDAVVVVVCYCISHLQYYKFGLQTLNILQVTAFVIILLNFKNSQFILFFILFFNFSTPLEFFFKSCQNYQKISFSKDSSVGIFANSVKPLSTLKSLQFLSNGHFENFDTHPLGFNGKS
jgi:hypothetical protein